MDILAFTGGEEIARIRYYSVGGGEILADGEQFAEHDEVYPLNSYTEISRYCREKEIRLWQYVEECEGEEIWEYLSEVWDVMQNAIKEGLEAQGILHGGIGTQRKARYLYRQKHIDESEETKTNRLICAYAYAVSEQNASGGEIVTAPTCGAEVLTAQAELYQRADPPRPCRGGDRRKFDQNQRLHQRCGMRLSGRNRHGLLHGGGRGGRAVRIGS